ncbi:UNVERIFIED_CONTAM: hypothetical protein GTU68_057804 [Idotea baltica]|nr:hypothetical protein [Idotea baltica]
MRPNHLEDYVGQQHLVGESSVLRQAIATGQVPSFILWGPPGVGKTTLANIVAKQLQRPFYTLSAINSGVKDIRETIQKAKSQQFFSRPNPILFIDEIHRFSKSQQDSLLGAVEQGIITLIGATTENPSFEVIAALLSRCQVYILKPIKSIRGSDPNGAVYWLARMIEGGEDVKFIARRVMIAAAEDIGLANPNGLLMATTAFQAVQAVGFPEARIILSQAVIYLATSPKSNSAYMAINKAQALVKQTGNLPVPLHLRNAPTQLMKRLDYGKDYLYSHDHPGNFVQQQYLPDDLEGKIIFEPQENNPSEKKIKDRLQQQWKGKYRY